MCLSHEHAGLKILAKIKIYILSRAKLLFTVWDEIPYTSQKSIWAKTTNITCCSFCTLVTICTFGCHWLPGFYLGEWTSYINSINLCRWRLCLLTEIKARVEENFEKNEWIDGFFLNWNLRANDALQDQKHLSLPTSNMMLPAAWTSQKGQARLFQWLRAKQIFKPNFWPT